MLIVKKFELSNITSSFQQIIEPEVLKSNGVSHPHTTHCLPNGQVMLSTLGDAQGKGKGSFITFDSHTFEHTGVFVLWYMAVELCVVLVSKGT